MGHSDSDLPQIKWRKVDIPNKRKGTFNIITVRPMKLMSFKDLVRSERTDKVTPENMLELEGSTEMTSSQGDIPTANDSKIIEVDLTADTPSESPEVSIISGGKTERKSRQDNFRQAEHREDNN